MGLASARARLVRTEAETQIVAADVMAALAYQEARRVVFDRAPTGPVDESRLSRQQLLALRWLGDAERYVDDLRHGSVAG